MAGLSGRLEGKGNPGVGANEEDAMPETTVGRRDLIEQQFEVTMRIEKLLLRRDMLGDWTPDAGGIRGAVRPGASPSRAFRSGTRRHDLKDGGLLGP